MKTNPDINNTELINSELNALQRGVTFNWGRRAELLLLIDKTEYWRATANSLTEWVCTNAGLLGAKPSSIWRERSSGRLYKKAQILFPSLAVKPLVEVSSELSAESLEILFKISRVAPKKVFNLLAARLLSGELNRSDLRNSWMAFRPVLEGKTSRGKGVTPPTAIINDLAEINEKEAFAIIINNLSSADHSWTQQKDVNFFKIFFNILESKLDAVAVCRTEHYHMRLHGIKIFTNINLRKHHYTECITQLMDECDHFWIALPSLLPQEIISELPVRIGIIIVNFDGIQTIRSAKLTPKVNRNTEPLLRRMLETALIK